MKKILFITIAAAGFLSSCEEDLDVKLPGATEKIVIEGSIENGEYAEVLITKNVPLFSSVSGSNLADYIIFDAEVYVTNGVITDTLTLAIDSTSSLGIVYKGHTLVGIPGQSYVLKVVAKGSTYSAITSIPAPIALDSVWWKADPPNDSLGFAWAHLSDPAGLGNNYRWLAKRPTQDRRFIAPYGATTDDKFFDGTSFDFGYSRGTDPTAPGGFDDEERGYYRITDTICIKICTLDRAAKDFYVTFESAVGNNGNPFASPVTVLSNLSGGALGVWAGFGVTYDTIFPPH